jgi:hypothetical protein
MVGFPRGLALLAFFVSASPARAGAEPSQGPALPDGAATRGVAESRSSAVPGVCRVINVEFTPGGIAAGTQIPIRPAPPLPAPQTYRVPEISPQIVAWLETPGGEYVHTIYITNQTGRYGMGNRPGRFDFNSGPGWPYGRRTTTFPVWSHKHGVPFQQIEFQSGGEQRDSNLSHELTKSSRELYYCRPLLLSEWQADGATCASTVYTDKGLFSSGPSVYPPRSDLIPVNGTDSPSVQMYKSLNPFDAVSQATPRLGELATVSWPMPLTLATGDYVLFMEVALEQDFNDQFNQIRDPSPALQYYGEYGVPYRGQPSVIYRVPFTVADAETVAMTDTYVGWGDPTGQTGKINPPDAAQITEGVPNTGASRLLLTSKDGQMFRVRVDARSEQDNTAPRAPGDMVITDAQASSATLTFVAPGDDDLAGAVAGYEVRYLVGGAPLTDANFDSAGELQFTGDIVGSGEPQVLTVRNLLPETEYTVAVRAFDNCHNPSRVTAVTFTTPPRPIGSVDACFVATAAYGSVLANDVEMLRRFRDMLLRKTVLGELAVEAYYTFGPPVAGVVGESDLLRETARDVLTPMVAWARGLRW